MVIAHAAKAKNTNTRGIASRNGASIASVGDLIGAELVIGLMYAFVGYALLRYMEVQSRTHASLERS